MAARGQYHDERPLAIADQSALPAARIERFFPAWSPEELDALALEMAALEFEGTLLTSDIYRSLSQLCPNAPSTDVAEFAARMAIMELRAVRGAAIPEELVDVAGSRVIEASIQSAIATSIRIQAR